MRCSRAGLKHIPSRAKGLELRRRRLGPCRVWNRMVSRSLSSVSMKNSSLFVLVREIWRVSTRNDEGRCECYKRNDCLTLQINRPALCRTFRSQGVALVHNACTHKTPLCLKCISSERLARVTNATDLVHLSPSSSPFPQKYREHLLLLN
jgi:hypothetical protein